ncbi:unnamed protein product, partial [Brachionus calyciflorus]
LLVVLDDEAIVVFDDEAPCELDLESTL